MAKDNVIIVRIERETKNRIANAARGAGRSLSSFIVEATMEHVQQIERANPAVHKVERGACPSFFKALCVTAQAGGESGYFAAGHELARHLPTLAPDEIDDDSWTDLVEKFADTLADPDSPDDAIAWLQQYLPRCLALVPSRRRKRLVEGMAAYHDQHGIG